MVLGKSVQTTRTSLVFNGFSLLHSVFESNSPSETNCSLRVVPLQIRDCALDVLFVLFSCNANVAFFRLTSSPFEKDPTVLVAQTDIYLLRRGCWHYYDVEQFWFPR